MERRLTTIMAADLVGYSRLMAADEEGVIARLRATRAEVVDPAIATAGGRIVKSMGDGLLVEFPSPVVAVRMSLDVQRAMVAREAGPEDARLRFRIGVNLGDVVEDGDDILGDGVNVAARLESLAPPGGICISRAVHDQMRGKIDTPMTALGPQTVKNIPEPIEVWRVEVEGVKAQAPRKEADRPSIAVLPFDNLSRDPDQDFLADGIVEDVITELSRFRSLFVIARNSTFAYKGTHKDIRQIASELGVRYVVEGSVRRAGERLRLTAQLIEAATGNHIWADRFDRTMDDIFDLQDELTRTLVSRIEPELGAHERTLALRKPPGSLNAWELLQRAYTEFTNFDDPDALARSEALCKEAIAADAQFALPYALLASILYTRNTIGRSVDGRDNVQESVELARRGVELDDRSETTLAAYGSALIRAGRVDDGRRAIRRALVLNPNSASVCRSASVAELHAYEPDVELMIECASKSVRLSPNDRLAWIAYVQLGHALVWRNFDWTGEAVLSAYAAASATPSADFFAPMYAAVAHAMAGEMEAAARYLTQARALRPGMTAQDWRSVFNFPLFPKMIETSEPGLQKLIALGLPEK